MTVQMRGSVTTCKMFMVGIDVNQAIGPLDVHVLFVELYLCLEGLFDHVEHCFVNRKYL